MSSRLEAFQNKWAQFLSLCPQNYLGAEAPQDHLIAALDSQWESWQLSGSLLDPEIITIYKTVAATPGFDTPAINLKSQVQSIGDFSRKWNTDRRQLASICKASLNSINRWFTGERSLPDSQLSLLRTVDFVWAVWLHQSRNSDPVSGMIRQQIL